MEQDKLTSGIYDTINELAIQLSKLAGIIPKYCYTDFYLFTKLFNCDHTKAPFILNLSTGPIEVRWTPLSPYGCIYLTPDELELDV